MEHLDRGEAEGKDGDVVFLAEGLRSLRDFFGRLRTEVAGAVEPKELAS